MDPYMEQAAHLALKGVSQGEGGPFGAVVVDADGKVLSGSCNRVLSLNDPTAHAEVEAIREACRAIGDFSLEGCTIYTTSEPCPMCLAAVHWARIEKVVYALTRNDAAAIGFDDAAIYDAMEVPTVEMARVDSPGATAAFELWAHKDDKTSY